MNTKETLEYNLALAWFEGKYNQDQAEISADIQGLNFDNVLEQYGNFYAECEALSNE